MDVKQKTITSSLLPDIDAVKDIETAKMFSDLCEETCSNLFAFSPYQLQIDKDTFLRFQYLADELKIQLDSEDEIDTLLTICCKLNTIYRELMNSCWNSFVYDTDIDSEPGKFIVLQLATMSKYEKNIVSTKNSL